MIVCEESEDIVNWNRILALGRDGQRLQRGSKGRTRLHLLRDLTGLNLLAHERTLAGPGLVASTTAQDRNMTNHHVAEKVSGDCTMKQEALKAHHSNKSSGPEHGYPLSGQHPDYDQPIANNGQYGDEKAKRLELRE